MILIRSEVLHGQDVEISSYRENLTFQKGELLMRNLDTTRNQIEQALADLPGLIPRDQLARLLGLSRRTLANKDSAGVGISNPLRVGMRVLYDKRSVIEWLVSRAAQHIEG
jgi:hypothetical protein